VIETDGDKKKDSSNKKHIQPAKKVDLSLFAESDIVNRGLVFSRNNRKNDTGVQPLFQRYLSGHSAPITDLDISKDGTTLATIGEGQTVRIWDIESQEQISFIEKVEGKLLQVRFLLDKNLIITGGWDKHIRIWEISSGKQIYDIDFHSRPIYDLSNSPDGRYSIMACADSNIYLVDLNKYVVIKKHHIPGKKYTAVKYSPLGGKFISGDVQGRLSCWDITKDEPLLSINTHGGWIMDLEWSSDQKTIFSACSDGNLYAWNISSGQLDKVMLRSAPWVRSLLFHNETNTIISGAENGKIVGWSMDSGEENWCLEAHDGWVNTLSYSNTERLLVSGSSDQKIGIWNFSNLLSKDQRNE